MAEGYEQQPFQINPIHQFSGDLNTLKGAGVNGFYFCNGSCTNCPRTYSPLIVLGREEGNYTTSQLLLGYNGNIYYRIYEKQNDIWTAWKTVSFTS